MPTGVSASSSAKPASWKLPLDFWPLALFCGLHGIMLLVWGYRNDFVTYRQDMGETHVAYRQSETLRQTFPEYGMLHVETSESGRKRVYTHNVNLGTYYFFFWRCLGVESRSVLTALILPVYLAGLLVAYASIHSGTGSRMTAWAFLGLMALDFANVGAFAFNALRAWHYVGLFGVLFGLTAIASRTPGSHPMRARLVTALAAVVSFGCGYDFFVIVAACGVVYLLLSSDWRRMPSALSWLVLCFLVPFVLRQLEVIYWMGAATWFTDFYVTVAIKVPFASRLVSIPSIAEIDALYEQAGLMRPPAYPTSDLVGIWNTAEPLARLALLPNYGALGCLAVAGCAIAGVATALFARGSELSRRVNLTAAYAIGVAGGLLAFAPFSLHVYLKHNFPLVAGLVHLAEAVCLVLAWAAARRLHQRQARVASLALFATCVLLVGNAVAVQVANARVSRELDLRWMARLDRLIEQGALEPGSLVAAVKMPPEADSLLREHAKRTTVSSDLAPWILARTSQLLVERPLVDLSDLEQPTTLVYAPGDGWCNQDAREPDLRHRDWLQSIWLRIRTPERLARRLAGVKPIVVDVPPGRIHPDDVVHLDFRVGIPLDPPVPRALPELEVQAAEGRTVTLHNIVDDVPRRIPTGSVSLIYNAKFAVLHVYARLPRELMMPNEIVTPLKLRGVLRFDTATIRSEPVVIKMSWAADRKPVSPILPEPTTEELCAAFGHFKIIERSRTGVGYVILDLASAS
jgi:hypothetical protein